MKVNNFIKKWWQKQNLCEKIATSIVIVSFIVQIIFMFVIPCFVIKLDYNITYIISMMFVALTVNAILYFVTLMFGLYIQRNCNNISRFSLIIVTILLTSICIWGNIEDISLPKKQDYIELLEYAENINSKEQLFETADSFSWYKESGRYYANFKGEKACELIVTFEQDFKIINTEWIDNYVGIVLLIFVLIICIMFATGCTSFIISLIIKKFKQK